VSAGNKQQRMNILVTGATGYIGSHVCLELKLRGYRVSAWDNCYSGQWNKVACDEFMSYDITKRHISGSYDAVIHLAGRSVVPQSLIEPSEYYRVNTLGTDNLLNRVETPHFIFAGTSSSWEMKSPYARSKVAAEDIIKQKAKGYTIFRFFNVSGTNGYYAQLGKASHLIRVAAEVATGKRVVLPIYGTDYPTKDGTCIRDYVHVVDVARAIVKAVEMGPANTPYECLGSKKGYSVWDVIHTMRDVTKHPIPTIEMPRRDGDAVSCVVEELSDRITLEKTLEDMCLDQYSLEKIRVG